MKRFTWWVFLFTLSSTLACRPVEPPDGIEHPRFVALMNRVAEGWSTQNTELALSAFSEDAVYMEPPDIQLYEGHEQLRPYFDALEPGHFMLFHQLWFDEARQVGAGEYSFGREGQALADHGIVVVELAGGRITRWREYQRKGPRERDEFLAREGKSWQWTIENYP